MKNDLSAPWRQMRLDEIEYGLSRSNAVHRDDLSTCLRTALQNVLEHAPLRIE